MKKFVKIISVVMCALLLVTGFFFAPKNINSFMLNSHAATTQAATRSYNNTYNYNADIVDGYYSGMGGLGISSFEKIEFNTYFLYHFRVNVSHLYSNLAFLQFQYNYNSPSVSGYFTAYYINQITGNNGVRNVNFNIAISSSKPIYYTINSSSVTLFFVPGSGSSSYYVDFYLSQAELTINHDTFQLEVGSVPMDNYLSYSGLGSSVSSGVEDLIDFDSDTNFELSFNYDSLTQNIFGSTYHLIKNTYVYWNNHSSSAGDYIVDLPVFTSNNALYQGKEAIYTSSNVWSSFYYDYNISFWGINYLNFSSVDSSSILINDLTYYTESIDFTINRPSTRVNNTLCIYNFDYVSLLDNVTSTTYSLSKDNNLYVVNYNGVLPNEKYINVGNSEINNIIFDTYIDLSFDYSKVPFNVSRSGLISYKFGFDFNFIYYTQPLITTNGTYNYTFDKPGYKDGSIEFGIAPPRLNIPFTAWIYNAFVFMIFYCPIVSDLIELLHFDKFMSGLIQIFNMFINSQIGDFVLGCFAFLILWSILKNLLPSVVTSVRSRFSSEPDESMKSYYQQQSDNFMKALNYKPGRLRAYKNNNAKYMFGVKNKYKGLSTFKRRALKGYKWKAKDYVRAQILKKPHYAAFHGKRNSRLKKPFVRMKKSSLQQKGKIRRE